MPGNRCAVYGCTNTYTTNKNREDEKKITMHVFPKSKDLVSQTIRKEWVRRCSRKDKLNPDNIRICSEHFVEADYERDLQHELLGLPLRNKLKKTAVPTMEIMKTIRKKAKSLKSIPSLCLHPAEENVTPKITETKISDREHSASSSTDDYQKTLIKIEEPSISQPSTSSSIDDYPETFIKTEETSLSFEDVDFIKSEPLDSLSETEAPINVSSNTSSASNIGKRYCRLCLMPTYDFATPIGAVDSHYSDDSQASNKNRLEEMQEIQKMIDICLPFYNPLTLNPVVCPTCVTHLKNSYNFAIKCLEKQQKIEEYINIYGTPEQVVNINDIIESRFLTSKVQNAPYKRTDTTTTNVPNTSIKKNKGKRNISNKVVDKDVDSPLPKKQKIHEESRKVNIDQDKEIRIKVEPGEDDNSNAAAPARIPARPNSKDRGEDLKTDLGYKDSLDLIKTVLVSGKNVGESENEEIDTRDRKGNNSHTKSHEENLLGHKNIPPECE